MKILLLVTTIFLGLNAFGQCNPGDQPVLSPLAPSLCAGEVFQISVTNNTALNDNTEWSIYLDSCNGVLLQSNSMGVFDITLYADADLFVQATGGCQQNGLCNSVSVNLSTVFSTPIITSTVVSEDSLIFHWEVTTGNPTGWQYSLDSGAVWNIVPVSIDSLVINGLNPNSCYEILVRPIGGASSCSFQEGAFHTACTECLNYNISESSTICEGESYVFPDGYQENNILSQFTHQSSLLSQYGCDSTVQTTINVNNVNIVVTQNGPLLSADDALSTYQWLDCNNSYAVVSGETSQTFTPSETGSYAVQITTNGCTDTSSCFLVDYTGIEELYQGEKLLMKIIDLTGRETNFIPNTPLIFIYSDGTRERVMKLEE